MNNNHIVVYIKPFTLTQDVWVYINGKNEAVKNCSLEDLPKVIYALAKQYNINNIDLTESNMYGEKIKTELLNKYADNNFNIVIHKVGGF